MIVDSLFLTDISHSKKNRREEILISSPTAAHVMCNQNLHNSVGRVDDYLQLMIENLEEEDLFCSVVN